MEEEFVPYGLAVKLKVLGFDEPCFNRFYTKPQSKMFGVDEKGRHYPIKNTSKKLYIMGEDFVLNDSNVISAPTVSQAFRWFRENYSLCIVIKPIDDKKLELGYNLTKNGLIMGAYTTYEKAEIACLDKLIEIVESKSE